MAKAFVASGNAVTTGLAAFATANQAESRIQQSAPIRGPEKGPTKCPPKRAEMPAKTGPDQGVPGAGADHKVPDLGRVSRICLECAAIFLH
jgi:hypothetical protein